MFLRLLHRFLGGLFFLLILGNGLLFCRLLLNGLLLLLLGFLLGENFFLIHRLRLPRSDLLLGIGDGRPLGLLRLALHPRRLLALRRLRVISAGDGQRRCGNCQDDQRQHQDARPPSGSGSGLLLVHLVLLRCSCGAAGWRPAAAPLRTETISATQWFPAEGSVRLGLRPHGVVTSPMPCGAAAPSRRPWRSCIC